MAGRDRVEALREMRRARGQEGSAFLIVVLLTLVVTALGTAMIVMSNTDHMIAANERDSEKALFSSKAGLDYAYYLFDQGLITPTVAGASFNSFASAVSTPLNGQAFTGKIFNESSKVSRGQLYRIQSTGTYAKGSRTTEIVFELVPESFKFGYMAFNEATLHNHSGLSGPTFRIETTIFSNDIVSLPQNITVDGSIVASGDVAIASGVTLTRDVFAHAVTNAGTIEGSVKRVTAVQALPSSAVSYNRVDNFGNKYNWYNGNSTPGTANGTILGTNTAYTIANGDAFNYTIFRKDGSLISSPNVNVTKYVPPPLLDYAAMKGEADKYEATYFTTPLQAMNYLANHRVTEVIGGKTLTTIKVGSDVFPEFMYVVGDLSLTLTPGVADVLGSGQINADGFYLEGGMYVSGTWNFDGPTYNAATTPAPPDYYQLHINALPYCLPAIVAYAQPSSGTIATWTPLDTPAMGVGSKITMSSDAKASQGFTYIRGATLSQSETHLHHTAASTEMIRFIGAELAWKIHNCDYFYFTYDAAVRCTAFMVSSEGTPQVVSYQEVR
jgi:Tfp pilus assembly protein PilX